MATLTRWDPFNEMISLHRAMSQAIDGNFAVPGALRRAQGGFMPTLDLSETQEAFLVEVAVPGLKPEDIEVTIENNVLTIKGASQQESKDEQRSYHRIERRYGSFKRSIALPTTVNAAGIQAALTDGILRLDIPKAEEVKPRRITVNVGAEQPAEIHNN